MWEHSWHILALTSQSEGDTPEHFARSLVCFAALRGIGTDLEGTFKRLELGSLLLGLSGLELGDLG